MKLGDICEFTYGNGLTEAQRRGGEVPVYGSNGIVGWHDQAITRGATIVVGRKGSIGEIHLSEKPCWPIDTTYYIDTTKKPCDLKWLYYILLALDLTKLNKSAAVPGLNRNDAYEREIPIPPLPEQQRIAAVLAKADRLRHLRRTARELSDTYLQSVFLEMFGDGNRFQPKELERLLLESPKNGLYLPADKYGNGTPIIRINNFYDGILNSPKQFKRVEASRQQIEEFAVVNGEILINRVNSLEYLGKCALVQGLSEATVFESNMMRIRVNTDIVLPIYLVRFLVSQQAYAQIRQRARKAVNQASINQQDVKSLMIPIPPLPLQQQFAAIVHKFERLRAQQREAERQAEHLFQSLLEWAFSGAEL